MSEPHVRELSGHILELSGPLTLVWSYQLLVRFFGSGFLVRAESPFLRKVQVDDGDRLKVIFQELGLSGSEFFKTFVVL